MSRKTKRTEGVHQLLLTVTPCGGAWKSIHRTFWPCWMVVELVPVSGTQWAGSSLDSSPVPHRRKTSDWDLNPGPCSSFKSSSNCSALQRLIWEREGYLFFPGYGHKPTKSHVTADRTGLFYEAILETDPQPHDRMTLITL